MLLVGTATGIVALASSCRDIVAPPPVATISLSDYSADLVPSETVLITATPKESAGTPVSRPVIWTTSVAAVATVENGLITAHAIGTAVISAESEGAKADLTVSVDDGGIVFLVRYQLGLTQDSDELDERPLNLDVIGIVLLLPIPIVFRFWQRLIEEAAAYGFAALMAAFIASTACGYSLRM